jgi:two-component system, cell cycle sensor histidine kinase and response regulator CckA
LVRGSENQENPANRDQDFYRLIADFSHDWETWMSPDGSFRYVSPSCLRITGYTAKAFTDDSGLFLRIIAPEHRLEMARHIMETEQVSAEPHSREFSIIMASGESRWIHHACTPVFALDGTYLGRRGSNRDDTARKRALESLVESEQDLKRSQAAAHLGHWSWDARSDLVRWSDEAQRIFGLDVPEKRGSFDTVILPAIHPEDRERVRESSHSPGVSTEYRVIWPDGSIHHVRGQRDGWTVDTEGNLLTLSGIVQDITERKRMEDALRQPEERFSKLFHQSPDAVSLTRRQDGVFLEVNRGFTDVTGWAPEEILGRAPDGPRIWPSPEDHRALTRALSERGEARGIDVRFRHRDGSIRHGVIAGRLIEIAGRECVVSTLRDITAQKRAAEALRRSEDRFRRLFDEAIDGIAVIDMETGIFHDCNKAFLRMTGYKRGELIGRHRSVLHAEGAGSLSFREGSSTEGVPDEQIRTRTGELRDVQIKADVIELAGRRYLQGFFRDTTGDRRNQRERESTLALLRLLNDTNHTDELIRNLTGFLQEWSKCEAVGIRLRSGGDYPYFETRGFPREFVQAESSLCVPTPDGEVERDAAGNPVLSCMCGNILCGRFDPSKPFFTGHGSFVSNCTTELLASTTEEDRQARTRNRCNGEGYESVALLPLRFGTEVLGLLQLNDHRRDRFTPELVSFLESAGDQIAIALAQRQAQAALAVSERRFRDISEAAGEFLWEMDAGGRMTYASERVADILERPPEDLIGREVWSFLPRESLIRTRAALAALKRRGRGWRNVELSALTPSGRTVWLDTTAVPLFGSSNRLEGFRGASMDVTERKRLAAQFLQAQKMEAVGQLAGGIAHDFNNLLQVISGNLDCALRDLPEGTRMGADLTDAAKAADNAARLTSQLLAFSSHQMLQSADIDLNLLVAETAAMLRRIVGEHISVIVSPAAGLGIIHADRGHVEQALMNLCINARDAMPAGGTLTISTENTVFDAPRAAPHPGVKEGSYVSLKVRDTGHGIEEGIRPRIFEPFFTTKAVGQGTGLGLATVYGIVKAHGGVIEVQSALGIGTEFAISFPRVERPVPVRAAAAAGEPRGGRERILLCEDEPAVLRYVTRLLVGAGYTVVSACDGEDALRVFDANGGGFDLALLDVIMPRLGGRGVMERIRKRDPKVRFLFTSGYTDGAIPEDFTVNDGPRLIRKPYLRNDLLRAVRETLDEPPA